MQGKLKSIGSICHEHQHADDKDDFDLEGLDYYNLPAGTHKEMKPIHHNAMTITQSVLTVGETGKLRGLELFFD